MSLRIELLLVLGFMHLLLTSGQDQDYVYLHALMDNWQNTPPNWVGSDPCGDEWVGITCTGSRVTSITLANIDLSGELSGDIAQLSELRTLDLSYNKRLTGSLTPEIGKLNKLSSLILVGCGFNGPLPESLGSLPQLSYLALNSNGFTGRIPPSFGNLTKLYWFDIADNKLSGGIPVSDGATPGLDLLVNTKHFHFGKNKLSGEIPSQLFSSKMTLKHVLFEDNDLTGTIPLTLGLVQNLEVLRLDRNRLSGEVPSNINNLTSVNQLFLSNNNLNGRLPNLTGMSVLNHLDMSNNSFEASEIPPWFSSLQSLTTLMMQNTGLQGEVPVGLFSIPQIETVVMRNNKLNGTVDLGVTYSTHLRLIDMTNNLINGFTLRKGYSADLICSFVGNPFCSGSEASKAYCDQPTGSNYSYSTPANNCVPANTCSLPQVPSPNCKCLYPYSGTLFFRAPSFSDLGNSTIYTSLQNTMMDTFESNQLPVDSLSLSSPIKKKNDYLEISLEIFPSGDERFNRSGISRVAFVFSNQTYKPPHFFGPYFFIGNNYDSFADASKGKPRSVSIGIIVGVSVGGCVLLLLLIFAGLYACRQKGRAEKATKKNSPFASWDPDKGSGACPQLKGARSFTYEELKTYTNNFTATANIGAGGFGMVYRGTLPNGQLVAIKRAQGHSTQGGLEFKTEIELLSRVHHKNVVSLVGFCFDEGEQMLVYEYIVNGTLKDSLSGKSGIRLDWMRRLKIIVGAARGLQYLHDLADPPIIHRDVKTTNILLDERLNAKVADFGLSKPMGDVERTHVTTQVKGTMGYMDPEYYMTQQLTEKSDVYSFGIVMLELITARNPIERGRYIVREVNEAMDKEKDLYNLREVLDPIIGLNTQLQGLERFVDIALRCVEDTGDQRPRMSEVMKEIENIMELAGINPNVESASTSESYEGKSNRHDHPYLSESLFTYSGGLLPSSVDGK
ncbi:probable leucine-rich repeat receptor-like protein kinase At5g49770 [Cynara cardunculus var. scolymus]|uniref:probable leucine-rich repeat receptor-like protein kinase At5g49770 n=1 Tax=Cynara cardunculus var. scolymus TaxID=59895 RepID=UPI000D62E838|nr:probable leucine-rich repeat receptor-like protein kinase At5g49770 [Cynara cardunculus var. scolymus]